MAADLLSDVPAGADVYILQHVLRAYDDATAVEMLRRCRAVLPPHGRVLVIEIVLPDVIDRVDGTLESQLMSDLNMLAVTGGRERSAIEWRALIEAAGLECRQINPVPGEAASMIEAARPGSVEDAPRDRGGT